MRRHRPMLNGVPPIVLLAVLALTLGPVACKDDGKSSIEISSPRNGKTVATCDVPVLFRITDPDITSYEALLDSAPIPTPITEDPPGHYEGVLPADALGLGTHTLEVVGTRASDGSEVSKSATFTFAPLASAKRIDASDTLITGPLAHNEVGDYLLENCFARYVIQDAPKRDLYSVGQYGGNLIDAELKGRPGLDNFLEVQSMVNVETVVNAQTVVIENDGSDGQPAVVRACGPDDLLDFVNPSTQIEEAGIAVPDSLDDNDQTVEGCTDYSVVANERHLGMTTTLVNTGGAPIELVSGDWMNASGELDVLGTPNPGLGPATLAVLDVLGFFGYGDAVGVDYAYTSLPVTEGSYAVISGVIVVLHDKNAVRVLLGLDAPTQLDPGEEYVLERFFSVGDGSGSNAVDLGTEIKGGDSATLNACVWVDSVPTPGAVVTVGEFDGSDVLVDVKTSFVADDTGCLSGRIPLDSSPQELGIVVSAEGTPYEGGGPTPIVHRHDFTANSLFAATYDLPATGTLSVTAEDDTGAALPVRVSVVGFDPSPPIIQPGFELPGFGAADLGLFKDANDQVPFGLVTAVHTGADGEATFPLEPGSYRVVVSRGTEYSIYDEAVTIVAGAQTDVSATLARVLDTAGFVSSDFHVHGINSADSRVSHRDRIEGYAGEGVDNIVMTDHHAHTDLDPTIALLGLEDWISSTIGEEITTFDYGHFNAYPFTVDPTRPSGGSTDWAVAAPAGQDFPSADAFNATPAEIFTLATTGATATADTTVQVNHIGSHFGPLQIDSSLVPPSDDLDADERLARRLDEPVGQNLFFHFPALELWNGHTRGAQREFLEDRIGIWFNLLNQGLRSTFIADTDSHRHTNLRMAGARTWTAAAPGSDTAGTVDDGEVARMVVAGKATGGQGVFVTTRLRATDGSGKQADLAYDATTTLSDAGTNVELDIRVQAPSWSAYDTIEVYSNAATTPGNVAEPYEWSATPSLTLSEGDCDATTVGDGNFDIDVVDVVPAVSGATRLESNVTVPFSGLAEDTWFVVVVKASDSDCRALFPVFPASENGAASNATVADLMDGNVGESFVRALGATNALYFEMPVP